ncbi:hypothetical protein DOTSEDRAFT_66062 [Dothistroma septosporum NZE10]|uniref:Uncharacterized protein n=1 Tax=Dothistroma septosporum (strain NZE10 / CBS 128990) TaxID=675120 RepID=N1PDS2_DOTSN|nr:hypothetical protein DOTSEDRAFT_66062 [Dothistroma septosporum NZE10]
MGTCLDWHSRIVSALPLAVTDLQRSSFALDWRQTYFDANRCIEAWHYQNSWLEIKAAMERLKKSGYEAFVHVNGTTRLQLDLCQSIGLSFDLLSSSQFLVHIKPALENYTRALGSIKREPDGCAAKKAGWKTVYVYRWTDDVEEDQKIVKEENDAWIEDIRELDKVIAGL